MNGKQFNMLKGIHPGFVVERELRKRRLGKVRFAKSVDEHPQTLVAIMKGRRRMNVPLALKIEKLFGWDEGSLMMLQVYFDIGKQKKNQLVRRSPDISKFRKVLFWDTDISRIDWQANKDAVIKRVLEMGNQQERDEITRFYGSTEVRNLMEIDSSWQKEP